MTAKTDADDLIEYGEPRDDQLPAVEALAHEGPIGIDVFHTSVTAFWGLGDTPEVKVVPPDGWAIDKARTTMTDAGNQYFHVSLVPVGRL